MYRWYGYGKRFGGKMYQGGSIPGTDASCTPFSYFVIVVCFACK